MGIGGRNEAGTVPFWAELTAPAQLQLFLVLSYHLAIQAILVMLDTRGNRK
jgi:hypothetical protein